MSDWVRFHRELRQGDKRGLSRATRFVYMELSQEARRLRGVVPLPVGMDDVEGVCDILGGDRREIVAALPKLTAGTAPMVRFEDRGDKRVLIVVEWDKWNPVDRTAADRQQARRDKLRAERDGHVDVTRDGHDLDRDANGGVTYPRARALISSVSVSDLREGETGEGQAPLPLPRPSGGRLPDNVFLSEKNFWIAAYERAVVAARGGKVEFIFPGKAVRALREVVDACCLGDDRRNIEAWIERDVGDFVRSILALNEDPSKRWSSFGPDGLQKWHNDGRPGFAPPRPSGVVLARPKVPDEPPMSPEETKAAAARVQALLGSFGREGAANGGR